MKIILYEWTGKGFRPDFNDGKRSLLIGENVINIYETELNYPSQLHLEKLVKSLFKEACIYKNVDYNIIE
ncbi:MAG: hypothetical protein IPO85_16320 [Saprospiraceae bacterium]|uniref:Uncharacterized protein n=1 Tax=Candidatus Defluviibacterium haderslevense TaxID=2981993 RepID=A0A9D7SD74_9BACT|nr:hypothetical protein [Candidatus Defluviibacterium haderslevense]